MFGGSKGNVVKFLASPMQKEVFPHPSSANKFLPLYYKNLKPRQKGSLKDGTAKACIPFLDACSIGYIIPLWADMHVLVSNGSVDISFDPNLPMKESLGQHSIEQIQGYPRQGQAYADIIMKLINPWIIETPPNYSCIFTSPLNHFESRIKVIDAVVDTDTYYNNINFPFVWTGGEGEFIIKQGTPIMQVIPFKRESHKLTIGTIDEVRNTTVISMLSTKIYDSYKELFWNKRKENSRK